MYTRFIIERKVLTAAINLFLASASVLVGSERCYGQSQSIQIINMVFSSDAHYGISRTKFRGDSNVSSHIVNAAMIQ